MSHHALNAARRERDLEALQAPGAPPLDVLVIGGGVTGAGVALDAASRGLRTALVELHDLAFGTSRWSSKLAHGGLRYLAQGAFGIAYESARERHVLLTRTAPHLVHPIVQAVPFTPQLDARAERELRVGLALGDGLRRAAGTSARTLPRARRATAEELLRLAPGVRRDGLRGALISHDAQLEDDARLVIAIARTAAAHGARILTRVDAAELGPGGARLTDTLTDTSFDVRAKAIINATGVWAGELVDDIVLRPSRGTHLVVPLDRLGGLAGQLTVPVPGERNRWVFAIAQRTGVAYVGLTDEEQPGPIPDVPTAPDHDVDFLLDTLNATLERPLTRDDVVGTYAGLRPLIETRGAGAAKSSDLSRRHAVIPSGGGIVSIVGGKLTTYRRMAQDAVDAAVPDAGPCRTHRLPLVGAAPRDALAAVAAPRRLVDRHGTLAPDVLALADGDPTLLAPLVPGLDVIGAEVLYAVDREGALDADDVLDRRTRIGLVEDDRVQARPAVEALLARSGQASAA